MKEGRLGRRVAAAVIVSAPPSRSNVPGPRGSEPEEQVTIGHTTVRIVRTAVNAHHDIAVVGIKGDCLPQRKSWNKGRFAAIPRGYTEGRRR